MPHIAPRVFVVDDDKSVRRALGRLLRSAGYETELFDAAEAYLAREAPQPPACLVLDVRMPGMTGMELQRAVKGTPRELPIVFITGHADEEFSNALAEVAVRVLYKPLEDTELLAAIEQALARSLVARGESAR